MKKVFSLLMVAFLLITCGCSAKEKSVTVELNGSQHTITGFEEIESSLISLLSAAGDNNIELYDCSELTAEVLENRKGTTIVERCIGIVTDKQAGDGRILNLPEDCGCYISYRGIYRPISDGTIMLSYMVYNPDSNYVDDIIERYDFVLSREWEE